jgi:phosphoribosylaminoimidazole (AIR) synthetase
MVVVVKKVEAEAVLADLEKAGEAAWVLGELVAGSGVVQYR